MTRIPFLRFVIAISIGALAGLGAFTFHYAEGLSYFSTDPKACANCHIMREQYDSWGRSSHNSAATCVECHLPHDLVPKYLAKARNGWNHSRAFTLQDFPEPIQITRANAEALRENCIRCHGQFVAHAAAASPGGATDMNCVQCHASVGHGSQR